MKYDQNYFSKNHWDSYYDPVPESILTRFEDEIGFSLPDTLRHAYLTIGDAPRVLENEILVPYYIFSVPENPELEIWGHCLNFFSILETNPENFKRMMEIHSHWVDKNLIPCARDGGGELLFLKNNAETGLCSVWHYSPSGRESGVCEPVKVNDRFDGFLQSVKFFEDRS